MGDKERLWHILDAIGSIEGFCKEVDEPSFRTNYMLQLAVVKLLEVIGEASARLSNELRDGFKEIEWPLIIRSRNVWCMNILQSTTILFGRPSKGIYQN